MAPREVAYWISDGAVRWVTGIEKWSDRVAFVTGASEGIGAVTAQRRSFAASSVNVRVMLVFDTASSRGSATWLHLSASIPPAAHAKGNDLDGVIPDDQRRGGTYTWPPPRENYVWEALQGAVAQAHMLHRRGYPAWGMGKSSRAARSPLVTRRPKLPG